LEKKALRDQEQAHLKTIEETQSRLEGELKEASRYVASMLPPPVDTPLVIRWRFETSTELGGDAFGYHWLDESTYAIYLLDVCGHGVGAALLSVAATNVLRSRSLPMADFHSPASVLAALDETFQMEKHDNMYFTIWYGVYDFRTGILKHASGGHPPALLLAPGQDPKEVRSPGRIVGVMPGGTFPEESLLVPAGSRLLVFSDGAYELRLPDGNMASFEDFVAWTAANGRGPDLPERMAAMAREVTGQQDLADDLSVLCIDFPGGGR
jgi:sigma-B regulation protein RsbU (phosphoserine phosphatase)